MNILLAGAGGFIGSALVDALARRGHALTLCLRKVFEASSRWPQHRVLAADFSRDHDVETWLERVAGVDVVINAVGIFREAGAQSFDALHARAPVALFRACAQAGVRRVIQISALGADAGAVSDYQRSKYAADQVLLALPVGRTIVRPSLVFSCEGASARLFLRLAALPLIPVPGGGQCVQPVHRDDLVEAIVALTEAPQPPERLDAVGAEPLLLREYLGRLRQALGLGRARFFSVPRTLARWAAALGRRMPGALLDPDALRMLERGNCAEVAGIRDVLGRTPRAVAGFITPAQAPTLRRWAQLQWLIPVLRGSIAMVWIVTAIVSLGLYPLQESYALLARVGIEGTVATLALYGAALLDLALGVATLAARRRRWIYRLQAALILGYTAIISVWLPEFWLHPFGPVLKNLPILAALWLLHELDEESPP